VIGCQHEHEGIAAILVGKVVGGERDGRGGIAACRFEQVYAMVPGVEAGACQLVLAHEVIVTVGHREDLAAARNRRRTTVGLVQQALAIGQLHEGLGVTLAGHGPEPGSGAAGKNDGDQHRFAPARSATSTMHARRCGK
jgi:hypothetical protein